MGIAAVHESQAVYGPRGQQVRPDTKALSRTNKLHSSLLLFRPRLFSTERLHNACLGVWIGMGNGHTRMQRLLYTKPYALISKVHAVINCRWLLSFNNYVLRQQEKDLSERLELLCAACRVAAATDGPLGPKTRGAAAAALRFPNQQERRRRVAVFLKEQGILGEKMKHLFLQTPL